MKTLRKNRKQNKTIKIMEKEEDEKVVFVFYTFFDKETPASWSYSKFPNGWNWVGSGRTSAVGEKKMIYENEEQFSGPKENQQKMITYLTTFFNKLKQKNYVKRFKIKKSYLP
jgi:hypothetical protein